MDTLLTIQDLAQLFQRSERQLYRDMAAKRFPRPTITLGKQKRWRREDIQAFIANGGKLPRTK